jgi:hypothetical protein
MSLAWRIEVQHVPAAPKTPRPCIRGLGPYERWLVRRIVDALGRHDRRVRLEKRRLGSRALPN